MAHNHILRRASEPGACPSCDVVWGKLNKILGIEEGIRRALEAPEDEKYEILGQLMQAGLFLRHRKEPS